MFEYFRDMHTTKSHLRYFDYCGNVLDAWGKTGGQQGDPLEMIENTMGGFAKVDNGFGLI